jgi:amidophosphoribosyltransferase
VAQKNKPASEMVNHVAKIYERFTDDQITAKVAELVYPKNIEWNGEVEIIFQTNEDLLKSIPSCSGDWFFSGNYPTPGGYKVLNDAFINYYENKEGRNY